MNGSPLRGAPGKVIKTYPQRGPMTQYRLEQATPFACFRCGQTKKSKLLTVYGDWARLLCNGCYGRLLSIYEIGAGTAPDHEKAERLAVLLAELVSVDDARGALRRQRYRGDPETNLAPETARFLGTAEFVAERLRGEATLEWSPAVIGLCKAAEYELVARLLEPLRVRCADLDLAADIADHDLQRVARWCAGAAEKPPELGAIRHALVTAINSRRRAETSQMIQAMKGYARSLPRGAWLLANDGLPQALAQITGQFRNRAAHTAVLDESDYGACRELVASDGGLLWRLVDATSA